MVFQYCESDQEYQTNQIYSFGQMMNDQIYSQNSNFIKNYQYGPTSNIIFLLHQTFIQIKVLQNKARMESPQVSNDSSQDLPPPSNSFFDIIKTPEKILKVTSKKYSLSESTNTSLQLLGSNIFVPRKSSAFQIYDPIKSKAEQNLQKVIKPQTIDQLQLASQLEENQIKQGQKVKKKIKDKDKRQMYRLQTKNLNRFFRSKINEYLRTLLLTQTDQFQIQRANHILYLLNKSNQIMFSEMRDIIKDQWLQRKFKKCRGTLLRFVHCGKMGMQSKLVMLKYFNKILKAIQNPDNFSCWK